MATATAPSRTATTLTIEEAIESVLSEVLTHDMESEPELHGGKRATFAMVIQEIGASIDEPAEEVLLWGDIVDQEPVTESVWMNLRPTEARRLHELVEVAIERAIDRALEVTLQEIRGAAMAFAAEFPDAPRGLGRPSQRRLDARAQRAAKSLVTA